MKNEVIKVLNPKHGLKVIKYFEQKGCNVKDYSGDVYGWESYVYY